MRFSRRVGRAFVILRDEGPRSFLARVFAKLYQVFAASSGRPTMLVATDDAASVDWTTPIPAVANPLVVVEGPAVVAWITSPPGAESGGHQNMWRFIDYMERAGHRAKIYLYDQFGHSITDVRNMLAESAAYPSLQAEIVEYDPAAGVDPGTHAIFATGWETAYPSFRDPSLARRFYFVQDFEPYFYPVGSEAVLAENTYRFGFHGITAGGWLAQKLSTEYGMRTDHFDFSVNRGLYHPTEDATRDEIFFYARPVTPRRAFEFGIFALEAFHRRHPEVTINLAGWDVSPWDIPFPYRNLSSLDISELNAVYNRCAGGLVISLTNMSLLPLELMSAGVVPVVNDAPNNRLVSDNPNISWVPLSPGAIAKALSETVERADRHDHARRISASLADTSWDDSGRQFIEAFERALRG